MGGPTTPSLFEPPPEEIRQGIERDIERLKDSPRPAPSAPSKYDRDDITASRHRGAETSEDAHEIIRSHKARMQGEVLRALRRRGPRGGTVEEIARELDSKVHSISPRLSELKAEGLAVATRRRRETTSGATATVVVAAEFAEASVAKTIERR